MFMRLDNPFPRMLMAMSVLWLAGTWDAAAAEQPAADEVAFSEDVFDGKAATAAVVDLDIGGAISGTADFSATEEILALDPQTMTEVGTKLDLARAYIDMGDPEGARSILEEVLQEGDQGQRQEAEGLMESLSA